MSKKKEELQVILLILEKAESKHYRLILKSKSSFVYTDLFRSTSAPKPGIFKSLVFYPFSQLPLTP